MITEKEFIEYCGGINDRDCKAKCKYYKDCVKARTMHQSLEGGPIARTIYKKLFKLWRKQKLAKLLEQ